MRGLPAPVQRAVVAVTLMASLALALLNGASAAPPTSHASDAMRRTSAEPARHDCPTQPEDASALTPPLDLQTDEVLDQAWRCTDQAGEHIVTVSRVRSPGQRGTQVLFTQRSRQAKGWKKDWQARDFFIAPTDRLAETRNRVVLHDADHDGHLEAYIAYVLPGPSQSVDEGKLLVFFNGRKFAIRGAIPRTQDDFGSRQIGSAFYALPAAVQEQALSLWDQLSKPGSQPTLQPVRASPP
jgi:hypothetical protein